ncbi:MAG: extracellular solute-binding protein [Candidatus Limnocylindrales bacterium]
MFRRHPRVGHRSLLAGVLATGLVAAGCASSTGSGASPATGSGPATNAGSGTTLTLYNAQHEQTTAALIAAFTAQTGITVQVDNDDEDVLTAQIEQEGSRSPADVFYTENSNWLAQLDEQHLLAKVDASTLANVPAGDSAASGDWVGVSARVSVLVYNTDKLSAADLPTSVLQLADPAWKGRIEIAPSEADFWPVVSSVAKVDGPTATIVWLKGLAANAGANDNVPDNETITSDVNSGVSELGLINQYYFHRLQDEVGPSGVHAAIATFAPRDPGYVEGISGAAILKSSTHQAAAQAFLAFLTSQAGQTALAASDSYEYPIHPGVAASPTDTPLDQLEPIPFTPADLGTGLDAKTLLQEAGLL